MKLASLHSNVRKFCTNTFTFYTFQYLYMTLNNSYNGGIRSVATFKVEYITLFHTPLIMVKKCTWFSYRVKSVSDFYKTTMKVYHFKLSPVC